MSELCEKCGATMSHKTGGHYSISLTVGPNRVEGMVRLCEKCEQEIRHLTLAKVCGIFGGNLAQGR